MLIPLALMELGLEFASLAKVGDVFRVFAVVYPLND